MQSAFIIYYESFDMTFELETRRWIICRYCLSCLKQYELKAAAHQSR